MRLLLLSVIATVGVGVAVLTLQDGGRGAAIDEIHALQSAQVDYYTQHGRYAASIKELAPELSGGEKEGYRFRVTSQGNSYTIFAEPLRVQLGGRRTFYADETLAIRESRGAPATSASPEVK